MRKIFAIWVALAAMALSGCDPQQWLNSFIPKEQAAIGQRYLEDIRTRNFLPVEQRVDPTYKTPAMRATLEKMASIFPQEKPKSIKVVGSQTVTSPTQKTYNLTYEYEFPHGWTLAHIYFRAKGNDIQIERMDVFPLKASLEQINTFTLANKTPLQYLILALAILFPIFTIGTAIACLFTPIPKRKWLWIVFVLLGFVSITLNWTTGAIGWNLISFTLFGAAYTQQLYGPVTIQIAFPVGAILFWVRRKQWKAHVASGRSDMRSAG
ncbi:MAG TPA: hypothetical protein VHW02_01930 [Rhizomicrobium sp.]|jgi:hypothetical protein|nr:hypothetical protein [Rhizomicrobium sp.]